MLAEDHVKFGWALAFCIPLVLAAGAQEAPVPDVAATEAAIKIAPSTLDFGAQSVGTTSPPQTATLTNNGSSQVAVNSIIASGIDFDQTNNCGTSLAAGAHCEIQVTFKPAITGSRLGNLTVIVSALPGVYMISLNGTGQ